MMASRTTPLMAPRTKMDWSVCATIFSCGGSLSLTPFNLPRTPSMMSRVEVEPVFMMLIRTAR